MPVTRLDSVVFETPNLALVRGFYLQHLGLRVGTFERDGKVLPDESEKYVNFDLNGTLLGFEAGAGSQLGTVVLAVSGLAAMLGELASAGVVPIRARDNFAIILDPDGREIILQEA
jgi:catechol 2,3-dioxygenase-like lactoylglutathione lyase family enzyme